MPLKSFEEISRDVRNRIYSPVYVFQGEEPYYIDLLADLMEGSIIEDSLREFNQTVTYGKDCDVVQLVSMAKRYPMMSDYQLVLVREAQEVRNLLPRGKSATSDEESAKGNEEKDKTDPFLAYVLNPQPSTVLVLCLKYKSIDKRSKLYKAIEKKGVVFESKKLYDDKLPKWIETYLADKKALIRPNAALLMAEHLGNDLSRIANECDKLLINIKPGETIDVKQIEQNIGISKEFNGLELLKAIGKKDILQATRIVNYFRENPKNNPIQMTLGMLYNYFSKLLLFHSLGDKSKQAVATALKVHPFFVDEYFVAAKNYPPAKLVEIAGLLRQFDLRSKGVGSTESDSGELTRELVYRIMH
ncbi:MAG: DNA polymerase III subunit delta [Bacteroidota bacterium]